MAKVLQGKELSDVEAKTSLLIKQNYDAGARTITSQKQFKDQGINIANATNVSATTNYWNGLDQKQQQLSQQQSSPGWLQKTFSQTADMAKGGAELVTSAAYTSVKDIGGLFVNAAMAIPAMVTANDAQKRNREIKRIEDEALRLYKQGDIGIEDYISRINYASEQYKQTQTTLEDFSKYQKNFVKTNASGDIDWTEQGISILSGSVSLFTLGAGAAVSQVVAGSVRGVATQAIAPRVLAIGAVATGNKAEQLAAKSVIQKTAISLDNLLSKSAGWNRIAEKGLTKMGTSSEAVNVMKNIATEAAIRAPIRRENLRFTVDVVDDYKEGNYFSSSDSIGAIPATVLVAGTLTFGGAVGLLTKYFPKGGTLAKNAMYGESSLWDDLTRELNTRGFKGTIPEAIAEIRRTGTKEVNDNLTTYLKQIQEYNINGRGARAAAEAMADAIQTKLLTGGRLAENVSMTEVVDDMFKWVKNQDRLLQFNKMMGNDGYAVVVKYDQTTDKLLRSSISKAINAESKNIKNLATHEERMAARIAIAEGVIIEEVKKNAYWSHNDDVVNEILRAIRNSKTTKNLVNAPGVVNARKLAKFTEKELPKKVREAIANDGYGIVLTKYPSRRLKAGTEVAGEVLKSKYVPVADEVFQKAATSLPVFRGIGGALTKAGIGLDESSQLAYREIRNASTEYLDQSFGKGRGASILNAVQQYIEDGGVLTRTATDARMLSADEILKAVKPISKAFTKTDAVAIRKAIVQAHLDAPLNIQGLANKLIAGSYKYNPAYKYYARAQGALRYSWNPFFRAQEIVETEMLGQTLSGGKKPWLYGFGAISSKTKGQLDDVVNRMEQAGFFHDGMMATRYGEAAQDVFIGRMSANITKTQKRSLAGVVARMAEQKHVTVEQLIQKHPQDVIDMIRPIIQYPTKGVLNSNFAKALNIAVFPARYNLKVTQLAVKSLAAQPPAVQLAVIDKLWGMEEWLDSDAGLSWQREHAQALGVFNWLTPIGSIQWVFDVLKMPTGKGKENVFDVGLVGGLPFGVISQILENQGLITISTPYVSPEKGEIYSKKIPESMKARGASALMDLLGSTFTYPGRTLGLPGKGQFLRDVASVPFDTDSGDWNNKIYGVDDIPEFSKHKQELWAQEYLKEMGYDVSDEAPSVTYEKLFNDLPFQAEDFGKKYTKSELNQIKQAAKAATAGASSAGTAAKDGNGILTPRTGARKATFPSNLPQ